MRDVEVEGWVEDTHQHGLALSQEVWSLSGRWFDFVVVDPDADIVVRENGVDVGMIADLSEVYGWVVGFTGVEL